MDGKHIGYGWGIGSDILDEGGNMRFAAWLFLTVCFCMILYYMGYKPIVPLFENGSTNGSSEVFWAAGKNQLVIGACQNTTNSSCSANPVVGNSQATMNLTSILTLALVAGILAFALFIAGFSAIYIIPLVILGALINFFVLPWSFIVGSPFEIPGMVIFNIITLLAVLNFVRGPT